MARLSALFAGLALMLPAACVSVLPEQNVPSALYRIAPSNASYELQTGLIVREPDAPRLLGGQGMVSEGADGGLRIVSGAEWAGRSTELLQLALIDRFPPSGDMDGGYALPAASGPSGDHELVWRIVDLSIAGQSARCEIDLTLIERASQTPVASTRVNGAATASGGSASARAGALSDAAGACVDAAARFVADETARASFASVDTPER